MRIVVVGGGVAGDAAALTIKARDPSADVAIVTDDTHLLYSPESGCCSDRSKNIDRWGSKSFLAKE